METPARSVAYINKTLFVSMLASLGFALSYTYWWFQSDQKEKTRVNRGHDYQAKWLGI